VQKAASIDATKMHLLHLGVVPSAARQNDFEVNVVNWSVDNAGDLTGTAKFLAVTTHDIIKATLKGKVPPPAAGDSFRLAHVDVTFSGGTGIYKTASGNATVVAKLYDDGLSVGHIVGSVTVP
jgi:hypothetical protein